MVLSELKNLGIKTGLLTTKGHDQAKKISKYFGLEKYLDSIEGRKNGVAIKIMALRACAFALLKIL